MKQQDQGESGTDSLLAISAAAFVEIIDVYVPLDKEQEYPHGYCPLCHSDDRCFSLKPQLREWFCPSCGESGDIYHLFEKMQGISREKAIRFVSILAQGIEPDGKHSYAQVSARPSHASISSLHAETGQGRAKKVSAIKLAEIDEVAKPLEPSAGADMSKVQPPAQKTQPHSELWKLLSSKLDSIPGYLGMVIANSKTGTLLEADFIELAEQDVRIIMKFLRSALKNSQAVLSDFYQQSGESRITLEFTHKSVVQKLIWIPFIWQGAPLEIMLLLEKSTAESLFLMKLKHVFER